MNPFICFIFVANHEARCTWSGILPPKNLNNPIYSCKVFLGGVPWDITVGKSPLIFCLLECKLNDCMQWTIDNLTYFYFRGPAESIFIIWKCTNRVSWKHRRTKTSKIFTKTFTQWDCTLLWYWTWLFVVGPLFFRFFSALFLVLKTIITLQGTCMSYLRMRTTSSHYWKFADRWIDMEVKGNITTRCPAEEWRAKRLVLLTFPVLVTTCCCFVIFIF